MSYQDSYLNAALTEQVKLLRLLVKEQQEQTELLRRVFNPQYSVIPPVPSSLTAWRRANPALAAACREATETLTRICNEHIAHLTEKIVNKSEALRENEFARNEFLDSCGDRTAHLNGLLSFLCLLGGQPQLSQETSQ